jgi:hypothetical protein
MVKIDSITQHNIYEMRTFTSAKTVIDTEETRHTHAVEKLRAIGHFNQHYAA